ncbi:MAG: CBS domain-containing protein [candidate division Zixibacteria bacterium]|nr:CBS domain-containing protein [candidate division Zixibacteria bacterium]NIR65113.1 CBS domain-containing protein [candidate division Zixibacteria bacterium]NIS17847.1 CBS domain-containing protein [candidate division Zixibacteria bacterium]NIS46857.1 CBS domain-containing protein [candidate division Zixibacteria bacterium]NIT54569.1 CBS domain-containing protein [candidate division Zixibacteria bacterium]
MKIKDILEQQGKREIFKVTPETVVKDGLEIIMKNRIGALLVMDENDKLAGIITERDILWRIYKDGEEALHKKVDDYMTRNVIVGIPDDDIETAEQFMTVNRFRHLPIMEGEKLVGLISIGDIVKSMAGNLRVQNRYLRDYITGKYPG